jgi:hypothetical protein
MDVATFHRPEAQNGHPAPEAPLGPGQDQGMRQHGRVQKQALFTGRRAEENIGTARLACHHPGAKKDGENGQVPVTLHKGQAGSREGNSSSLDG